MEADNKKNDVNLDEVVAKYVQALRSTTNSPAEQHRILQNPIDIVCFGRSGVGKSSLLGAITRRDFGATASLDHGTQTLTGVEVKQSVSVGEELKEVPIRFWDTKGIDKWEGPDVEILFKQLQEKRVNPICAIYCASASGRVQSQVVRAILKYFYESGVLVFYVYTNMYAGDEEQFTHQTREACEMLKQITGSQPEPRRESGLIKDTVVEYVYSFATAGEKRKRAHFLAVNSVPYSNKRTGSDMAVKNVDILMELCVENLDEERLIEYFLATIANRDFWARASDRIQDALHYLSKHCAEAVGTVRQLFEGLSVWINDILSSLLH